MDLARPDGYYARRLLDSRRQIMITGEIVVALHFIPRTRGTFGAGMVNIEEFVNG